MICVNPLNRPIANYSDTLSKSAQYLDETIKKTSEAAYNNLIKPISIGVAVGVFDCIGSILINECLAVMRLSEVLVDEALEKLYIEECLADLFDTIVFGPILEEIIFRVIIQGTFHWIASRILPDIDVEIFSSKIKLAALVAVVASAILFGLAHLSNGTGIPQAIICIVSGVVFGMLKHNHGLLAPTAAHITTNALGVSLLLLEQH